MSNTEQSNYEAPTIQGKVVPSKRVTLRAKSTISSAQVTKKWLTCFAVLVVSVLPPFVFQSVESLTTPLSLAL